MNTTDWKVFRRRVPAWRERYLRRKNQELIELLGNEAYTPTERFWQAEERVDEEARVLRTCLDGHSKGKGAWYLSLMYGHGMIEDDDLDEFSEGLRETVRASVRFEEGEEAGGAEGGVTPNGSVTPDGSGRSRPSE